jgi:hypothetical protein
MKAILSSPLSLTINKSFFILFLLLLIAVDSSQGQKLKQTFKYGVDFFYYPALNTYHISRDTQLGNLAIVKPHLAHNFGIVGFLKMNNRFIFKAGLGLSDYGYEMEYSGQILPIGLYKMKVNYLDVPLELHFALNSKSVIEITAFAGFSPAFLLYKSYPYYATGGSQLRNKYFDNFDLYTKVLCGLNIGATLKYNYSRRIALTLQPMQRWVTNKNTYSSIQGDDKWSHFSSLGLRILLSINLNENEFS